MQRGSHVLTILWLVTPIGPCPSLVITGFPACREKDPAPAEWVLLFGVGPGVLRPCTGADDCLIC